MEGGYSSCHYSHIQASHQKLCIPNCCKIPDTSVLLRQTNADQYIPVPLPCSGFTSIAAFLLTREVWNSRAGLLAACFIAIVPGYISRSVAGSYDNEGIAIFALLFTYYLWLKSVKTGSVFWATSTALSYFYMVGERGEVEGQDRVCVLLLGTLLLLHGRGRRGRGSALLILSSPTHAGVCLGWLCVHHQPHPTTRVCAAPHGKILPEVRSRVSWGVTWDPPPPSLKL